MRDLRVGGQTISADMLQYEHLREIRQEDVCYADAKPRLLIGADNWHLIVTRRLLTGEREHPAASLTALGWIVHGVTPRKAVSADEEKVLHVHEPNRTRNEDNELHDLVKAHFEIDALGITTKRRPVPQEEKACEIFRQTVRHVNGRYEVGLPWASEDIEMPPSYDMARRRLLGIEKKMDRSPLFKDAYTAQMERLLEKGYAEKVESLEPEENPKLWYLPHFAVTNPNKPGKVRVVFDAAAQANGVSLNDKLLDGPDKLQSIFGVMFRFRENTVAISADIREMFLQVKIRQEDRAAQHFLWRGERRTGAPQVYVMSSMIFGARSSPFLAHSVRDQCAIDQKEEFPMALEPITRNHYMDDWLDSFPSEEVARETIIQVRQVYGRSGFELAGWCSSHPAVLQGIPEQDKASAPRELGGNVNSSEKTLGILWTAATDELSFNTRMPRVPEEVRNFQRIPTKREALGVVMSLFDPLGLLSPYSITAKIMLQELWRHKIEWDESLPPESAAAFSSWYQGINSIRDLTIPRCYCPEPITHREIHVFCDASEQAYAAVAYWRLERADGRTDVSLIAGKAKVSPLKAQSIPRLELQACLIGARLADAVRREHRWEGELVCWSDSRTALSWIRNDSPRYPPYVAHRLGELAELTNAAQWRWVPTMENPADLATRAGHQLHNRDMWFTGPEFLMEPHENWPTESAEMSIPEGEVVAHLAAREPLIDIKRFSSYERLVRSLAYVFAFIAGCKRQARGLKLDHIQRAERELTRTAQEESFPEEMGRLRGQGRIARHSRLFKLGIKLDSEGVMRIHGRINAIRWATSLQKEPPVLDGRHRLVHLLIEREHKAMCHAGRESVVNGLRQRLWILHLRPTVRKILSTCVTCKLKRGSPSTPGKGDLPPERMTPYARPFTHCGVDCFGPMWVTVGRRREKRWGMLFTCLVVRAVHIELVASLSTDSAIMALRRMGARRGWPKVMWSDNGTNFRGASMELREAYKDWLKVLPDYLLTKRIEWRFIDPGAPNQGGAWERLVRSVKSALEVTLTARAPKPEVLDTLLAEAEHTVNSRPLTHVPVEADEEEGLTPNHFLIGQAVGLPLVGECSEVSKQMWRSAQALADSFWKRWIMEYLPNLIPRNDKGSTTRNVKLGELVLIADGLLPRNMWPRGRIVKTFGGPDGAVRSAEVLTRGGADAR